MSNIKYAILFFIFNLYTAFSVAQDRPFLPIISGMEISGDILFQPGKYILDKDNWHPIIIEGSNIDLNFNDAELFGANDLTSPPDYNHVAIIIRNAKHVKIRNLRIYRFKIAIQIENSSHITIENCDISYMNRPLILNDLFPFQSSNCGLPIDSTHNNSSIAAVSIYKSSQIKVKNNYFNSNFRSLILVECNDIDILNNYFQFNSSYPVIFRDCNSFSFWHNRLDYNFLKTNDSEFLGLKYNSSTLSNVLLIGACSDFKIAFNQFTHGTSAIKMDGTHHNALIVDNTMAYMDGSVIILKGIDIQLLNNHIYNCFNAIRILDGTGAKIMFNQIEHCGIGFLHSHNLVNNQITIRHNKISHNKVGFHLPIKKQRKSCNNIKSKILIQHNCLIQNEAVFSVLNSPIISVFKNNSGNLRQYSSLRNDSSKLISKLQKNNKELKTIFSLKENEVLISCLQPVSHSFTKHEEGMSVDHGLYNYNDQNSMINAQYGPYDFRYPFATKSFSSTSSNQLLVLGPLNQNYTLIKNNNRVVQDIRGKFHDTLDLNSLGLDAKRLDFIYTGHHFKNDRGTFIPTNDTFKFHVINIHPESPQLLSCYKSSDVKKRDTFYIDNIGSQKDLLSKVSDQTPLIISSEIYQYDTCELHHTYKISEVSNFHFSANKGTKLWVNNILKMEFTQTDIHDYPEIQTMMIMPDERPYTFKFEFEPKQTLQLLKVKWTK